MADINPKFEDPDGRRDFVLLAGQSYLNIQRFITALEIGHLEVRYAAGGGQTGFNIPEDIGAKIQLILPLPPKATAAATCNTDGTITFTFKFGT